MGPVGQSLNHGPRSRKNRCSQFPWEKNHKRVNSTSNRCKKANTCCPGNLSFLMFSRSKWLDFPSFSVEGKHEIPRNYMEIPMRCHENTHRYPIRSHQNTIDSHEIPVKKPVDIPHMTVGILSQNPRRPGLPGVRERVGPCRGLCAVLCDLDGPGSSPSSRGSLWYHQT